MAAVAGERSGCVRRRVQLARFVTVVDQEDEPAPQTPGRVAHPLDGAEVDLHAPAGLRVDAEPCEIFRKHWGGRGPFDYREAVIILYISRDPAISHRAGAPPPALLLGASASQRLKAVARRRPRAVALGRIQNRTSLTDDVRLAQALFTHHHLMHGQCVEELVGDDHTVERTGE